MRKVIILCILFAACTKGLLYSSYQAVPSSGWDKNEHLLFEYTSADSVGLHNLFITIRNDESFPYSNLFLITTITFPGGNQLQDTLEYAMAEPDGRWLGSGMGSVKESKLWYKENVVFPENGVYRIHVAHAMRHNGEELGIDRLQGITDVGLEIEKAE